MKNEVTGKFTTYLGDGAYAEYEDYGAINVYTFNGIDRTNEVVLGHRELKNLIEFGKQMHMIKQ